MVTTEQSPKKPEAFDYDHETSQTISWIKSLKTPSDKTGFLVIWGMGDGPHIVLEEEVEWRVDDVYSDNYSFASFQPIYPGKKLERAIIVCPSEEKMEELKQSIRSQA